MPRRCLPTVFRSNPNNPTPHGLTPFQALPGCTICFLRQRLLLALCGPCGAFLSKAFRTKVHAPFLGVSFTVPTSISRPVIYKVSRSVPPTSSSLAALVTQALQVVPSGIQQCRPLDDQGAITAIPAPPDREFQILSQVHQEGGTVFGKLIHFTGGQHHSTLSMAANGVDILEQAVSPGAGKDFVDASLYFLISGNHVVVAQSMLREQQLCAYLDWLLETTSVYPGGTHLFFEDKPHPDHQLALTNIKSVSLGAEIETPKLPRHRGQVRKRSVPSADKAVKALKAILGMNQATHSLPSEMLDRGTLKVRVDLIWNTRKPPEPNEFIDGIANVLSATDLDYTIYPLSGGSITADQIKISSYIKVTATNSIPDPTSVRLSMKAFLANLVRLNRV